MKILAVDTATEQCSAAIVVDGAGGTSWSRSLPTAREHAKLLLPMIDELLLESRVSLAQLDGLAFGRGPGSFTGVRIAVGAIQGLALARNLAVVGISDLAAVAQHATLKHGLSAGAHILVCMDARMREVYWAEYTVGANGLVILAGTERVSSPTKVHTNAKLISIGAGTGWRAYSELGRLYSPTVIDSEVLPRALEICELAHAEFLLGRAVSAANAQPVYLRDEVATVRA